MQEFLNTIKQLNLHITDNKKEAQIKDTENNLNKVIEENSPNPRKRDDCQDT